MVERPNNEQVVGRFAPSPTGRMHAGNIFAALCAWLIAKSQGGVMVLRVENLDRDRSKPHFIDAVMRDFEALGLTWDRGPFYQHDRDEAYRAAYERICAQTEVYPCFCTRADLHAASAPNLGEKMVYPGTCRGLSAEECAVRAARLPEGRGPAYRVHVPARTFSFVDQVQGPYGECLARDCGDFILRRADGAFAYQLAVVVDDAEQGVNSVVRGVDLLDSSPQQRYVQELLGLPPVTYAHAPLIVAADGRRLAKRDKDAAYDELLARFGTPAGVIGHIAGLTGLAPTSDPVTPEELLADFSVEKLAVRLRALDRIAFV